MQETAYPRCFNSLDAPRDRFAVDSPLEGDGFEPSVPLAIEGRAQAWNSSIEVTRRLLRA